jgi:hypothetical protein
MQQSRDGHRALGVFQLMEEAVCRAREKASRVNPTNAEAAIEEHLQSFLQVASGLRYTAEAPISTPAISYPRACAIVLIGATRAAHEATLLTLLEGAAHTRLIPPAVVMTEMYDRQLATVGAGMLRVLAELAKLPRVKEKSFHLDGLLMGKLNAIEAARDNESKLLAFLPAELIAQLKATKNAPSFSRRSDSDIGQQHQQHHSAKRRDRPSSAAEHNFRSGGSFGPRSDGGSRNNSTSGVNNDRTGKFCSHCHRNAKGDQKFIRRWTSHNTVDCKSGGAGGGIKKEKHE